MTPEHLQAVVDHIYDASLDPELWPSVLMRLGTAFHASAGAVMFVADSAHGRGGVLAPPERAASIGDYVANWAPPTHAARGSRPDPRDAAERDGTPDIIRAASRLREGDICADEDVMSRATLTRTAFYNEHLVRFDFHHAVGAKVWDGPTGGAVLSLSRGERQGRFSARDVEALTVLLSHLRRAFAMTERLAWTRVGGGAGLAGFERAAVPSFVLDQCGRRLSVNAAAEALMADGDGLSFAGNGVRAVDPGARERLDRAIALAVKGDERGCRSGSAVQVPRPSGRAGWAVLVTPVALEQDWMLPRRPRALVTVVDPTRSPAPTAARLKALFGLTSSEAAVAIGIGTGAALKTVAADLDLTIDSARQYLSRVYAKTDTRRQSDLARLMSAIAAG